VTLPIEHYALIGDQLTAALVGRDGSIDWLCWGRFDSDACMAALLGSPDDGRWMISPCDGRARVSRHYQPGTLILITRFETEEGALRLVDFMPLRERPSHVVRLVIGERGRVGMRFELVLRFGYGAVVPWVTRLGDGRLRAIAGPDMVLLRSPIPLRGEQLRTVADFTVGAGETLPFVLSYCLSHLPPPDEIDALAALESTASSWTEWSRKGRKAGKWAEAVERSLITLSALTYAPTGGIVAAPTTSLPERIGGSRNWDYRFCWLRDATLSLLALMNGGYYQEAAAWREWLLRAVAGSPDQVQVMYGIAGERRLTEWSVPWLKGYEGSQPVRIGNDAHAQLQLDVYGEMIDAFYHSRLGGLGPKHSAWDLEGALLAHLEAIWREPDESIWEVRGGRQQFTYSKVMCWVGFDRAIRTATAFGLPGPVERWRALAATIHEDVCRCGFNSEKNSFVQAYGSSQLDASMLLLPALGFLPPEDERVRGTVAAIERELVVDGLVMRYDSGSGKDGLPAGEGAFLPCSFWLVDAYALGGRMDAACELFERLLALRNVGLLSEEYDVGKGRLVGNFPQLFRIWRSSTAPIRSTTSKVRGPARTRVRGRRPRARNRMLRPASSAAPGSVRRVSVPTAVGRRSIRRAIVASLHQGGSDARTHSGRAWPGPARHGDALPGGFAWKGRRDLGPGARSRRRPDQRVHGELCHRACSAGRQFGDLQFSLPRAGSPSPRRQQRTRGLLAGST
jgi:GH15 family glucan-1,4-alpha-glucosidase